MQQNTEYTWQIAKITDEAPQVQSLYLAATAERPDFIAGQYLTLKLPNLGPAEGKAYSISSAPHEELVRISIKKIGRFSQALLALPPGAVLHTTKPYGFFYPERDDQTPLVFVIGGIGITPSLSIIKDIVYREDQRPVYLLYSNRTEADIVFRGELAELAAQKPNLIIHHFITREKPETPGFHHGRMQPADFPALIPEAAEAEYFLCGAMEFTKALWKELRDLQISQPQIYTEGFF